MKCKPSCYTKHLARPLLFFLIGICIAMTLCSAADEELINTLSANVYTQNASRFTTTLDQENMEKLLARFDPKVLVYCELDNQTTGLYSKNPDSFPVPLINGQLGDNFGDISGNNVAAIGSRVDGVYSKEGIPYIDIHDKTYEIVATLGIENIHTFADYKVLIPLSDALPMNTAGVYIIDGHSALVKAAMEMVAEASAQQGANVRRLNHDRYGTAQVFQVNSAKAPIAYLLLALLLLFVGADAYFEVYRCRVKVGILNLIGVPMKNIVRETAKSNTILSAVGLIASCVFFAFRPLWFIDTGVSSVVSVLCVDFLLILLMFAVMHTYVYVRTKRDVAAGVRW